jgi:hypothetical protein
MEAGNQQLLTRLLLPKLSLLRGKDYLQDISKTKAGKSVCNKSFDLF